MKGTPSSRAPFRSLPSKRSVETTLQVRPMKTSKDSNRDGKPRPTGSLSAGVVCIAIAAAGCGLRAKMKSAEPLNHPAGANGIDRRLLAADDGAKIRMHSYSPAELCMIVSTEQAPEQVLGGPYTLRTYHAGPDYEGDVPLIAEIAATRVQLAGAGHKFLNSSQRHALISDLEVCFAEPARIFTPAAKYLQYNGPTPRSFAIWKLEGQPTGRDASVPEPPEAE